MKFNLNHKNITTNQSIITGPYFISIVFKLAAIKVNFCAKSAFKRFRTGDTILPYTENIDSL